MQNSLNIKEFILFIIFFSFIKSEFHNNLILNPKTITSDYFLYHEINQEIIEFDYIGPQITSLKKSPLTFNTYKSWKNVSSFSYNIFYSINNDKRAPYGLQQKLNGGVQIKLSQQLYLQHNIQFENNGVKNRSSLNFAKQWWHGKVDNSSLIHFYSLGHLLLGRGNLFALTGKNSLLINSNISPVDYLWWSHKKNYFKYDWSIMSLDKIVKTSNESRMLVLHRFGYESKKLRLGFSEMALFKYANLGSSEIEYIMPTAVLYEVEANGEGKSNVIWCFDSTVKNKNVLLNIEFLIDDYALDNLSPNKLGYKLGVGYNTKFLDYYFEYARINRWTGNYYYEELRYKNIDKLIGHPIGPDAHAIDLSIFKEISKSLFLSLNYKYLESGDGNINEWPNGVGPSENFGYSYEPFPSSPIKKTSNFQINLEQDYKNLIKINYIFYNGKDYLNNFQIKITFVL